MVMSETNSKIRSYDPKTSVVFLKTTEKFGGLSNMAAGYPLEVNGIAIRTSEALYQALRFPHMPDLQRTIIDEVSPMTAKMRTKPHRENSREDWDRVRVKIMRWCLQVKLAQNLDKFGALLLATGEAPIVEYSKKDQFWGAEPTEDGRLVGMNVLGRLLMELREQLQTNGADWFSRVEPLPIDHFELLRRHIGPVVSRRSAPADATPSRAPPRDLFSTSIPEPRMQIDAEVAPNLADLRPYAEMKDTGLAWLPRIPAHWEMWRNGRLFGARRETGFPDLPILEVSLRSGVRVRDMESGRKQQMADRSKYLRAKKGDIAYNMMRMWQGAVGVVPEDGLVSPAYVVATPFPEADARYYAYLFRTAAYMGEVDAYSRGIVKDRNRLYWESFKQISSAVPPLEEQRLIVRFLDWHGSLTAKLIRAKKRIIELASEERRQFVEQIVRNPKTTTERLDHALRTDVRAVHRDGQTQYRPIGLYNRGRGIFVKPALSGLDLGDSDFSWVESGDVILSGQFSWEGAVAIATDKHNGCVASHRYHIVRSKTKALLAEFIWAYFRSDYGQLLLDLHSIGAAGRNRPLNPRALFKERISIPTLREQERVQQLVLAESAVIASTNEALARLAEFRTRLIADVVTGALDIRSISASLPDVEFDIRNAETLDDSDESILADDSGGNVEDAA